MLVFHILVADKTKENVMNKNLVNTILKAIALAMGVAVVVLSILGTAATSTVTLLGFGLTSVALVQFMEK